MTAQPTTAQAAAIVLVADDFAISDGVSSGIEQLTGRRRISGTSALVTLPRWRTDGARLAALRGDIAIGLHIDLTLGRPLGAMPSLAPAGSFPAIGTVVARALARRIDGREISAEIARQIDAFAQASGYLPDFVDGHQHVHALPVVRRALLDALQSHFQAPEHMPLVRAPTDRLRSHLSRGMAANKAITLSALSAGFAAMMHNAGFPTNDSFAGVTNFAASEADVIADLEAAARAPGRLHLVMCHPGIPTDELASIDPILDRRATELCVLGRDNALTARMWHPDRAASGERIDWGSVRESRS